MLRGTFEPPPDREGREAAFIAMLLKVGDGWSHGLKDELRNMMLNEPVNPGSTISHATAQNLKFLSLIEKSHLSGCWVVRWDIVYFNIR